MPTSNSIRVATSDHIVPGFLLKAHSEDVAMHKLHWNQVTHQDLQTTKAPGRLQPSRTTIERLT